MYKSYKTVSLKAIVRLFELAVITRQFIFVFYNSNNNFNFLRSLFYGIKKNKSYSHKIKTYINNVSENLKPCELLLYVTYFFKMENHYINIQDNLTIFFFESKYKLLSLNFVEQKVVILIKNKDFNQYLTIYFSKVNNFKIILNNFTKLGDNIYYLIEKDYVPKDLEPIKQDNSGLQIYNELGIFIDNFRHLHENEKQKIFPELKNNTYYIYYLILKTKFIFYSLLNTRTIEIYDIFLRRLNYKDKVLSINELEFCHGDLNPSNIVIAEDNIKFIDYHSSFTIAPLNFDIAYNLSFYPFKAFESFSKSQLYTSMSYRQKMHFVIILIYYRSALMKNAKLNHQSIEFNIHNDLILTYKNLG